MSERTRMRTRSHAAGRERIIFRDCLKTEEETTRSLASFGFHRSVLNFTLTRQLRGEDAGMVLMAEKARISGDFWFVTFDAHRLGQRFKVTLESVRIAIHLRTCVADEIFCVVGIWIQGVAGLASLVTCQAEVRRMLESGEWVRIGFGMRGQPVDHDSLANVIRGMAFHADPWGILINELLENVVRP